MRLALTYKLLLNYESPPPVGMPSVLIVSIRTPPNVANVCFGQTSPTPRGPALRRWQQFSRLTLETIIRRSETMNVLKLFCATAVLIAIPTASMAYGVGYPDTYSDLLWRVSSNVPGLSGCTELQVDATGDLNKSSKLSIYGALNCPQQQGGSYGVVGGAYFGSDGSFNMTLIVGSSTTLECTRLSSSLSGSCVYYNTSGATLGPAYLTFR